MAEGKRRVKRFYLTHSQCDGHETRKGFEPCTEETHPGGTVHIRPFSMNWRQGLPRDRVREIFGIDLKPGQKAIIECKVVNRDRYDRNP